MRVLTSTLALLPLVVIGTHSLWLRDALFLKFCFEEKKKTPKRLLVFLRFMVLKSNWISSNWNTTRARMLIVEIVLQLLFAEIE